MTFLISPIPDVQEKRDATIMHFVIAISLITIGIVALGFAWFAIVKHTEVPQQYIPAFATMGWACLGAGIAIIVLAITRKKWLRKQRNSASLLGIEIMLLAVLGAYFAWQQDFIQASIFAFMTIALSMTILWERRHRHGPEDSKVTAEGVTITGGKGAKTLAWWQVEKVMIAHGVLTVEAQGNRVYQRNIHPVHFDKKEFDSFCNAHIMAAEAKRKANADW